MGFGGGMRSTIASRISSIPIPSLALAGMARVGRNGQDVLELLFGQGDVGVRQVDLVDDRDDREVLLHRQVNVGDRLGLDPLGRVHDQQRAFAGAEAARDLVA